MNQRIARQRSGVAILVFVALSISVFGCSRFFVYNPVSFAAMSRALNQDVSVSKHKDGIGQPYLRVDGHRMRVEAHTTTGSANRYISPVLRLKSHSDAPAVIPTDSVSFTILVPGKRRQTILGHATLQDARLITDPADAEQRNMDELKLPSELVIAPGTEVELGFSFEIPFENWPNGYDDATSVVWAALWTQGILDFSIVESGETLGYQFRYKLD